MRRPLALVPSAALLPLLAGCAAPAESPTASSPASPQESTTVFAAPAEEASAAVVGRVLRIASEQASVDVTIREDDPAVRDLLGRLPLELTAEEFAGKETIARIPGGLHLGTFDASRQRLDALEGPVRVTIAR